MRVQETQCATDSREVTIYCRKATIYVTGDLAFQPMALGKESMAGWWCMLCKASRAQFLDEESGRCARRCPFRRHARRRARRRAFPTKGVDSGRWAAATESVQLAELAGGL
jgi:hypothetical protein